MQKKASKKIKRQRKLIRNLEDENKYLRKENAKLDKIIRTNDEHKLRKLYTNEELIIPKNEENNSMSYGMGGLKDPNDENKLPRLEDLVEVHEITKEKTKRRLIGPVYSYVTCWIKVKTKNGKDAQFPVAVRGWNCEKHEYDDPEACPFKTNEMGRLQTVYLCNSIDRDAIEPKKKTRRSKSEKKQVKFVQRGKRSI